MSARALAHQYLYGSGREQVTLSGAAFSALEKDLADARLKSHLGAPLPPAGSSARAHEPSLPGTAPTGRGRTAGKLDPDEVAKDLAHFEGSKRFMYQDSRGFMTTGVGHLIKTPADAAKLPWINSATGKSATKPEIDAEFARVDDMPTGREAEAYKQKDGLVLPEGKAEQLAGARLEKEFLPGLRKMYPAFDSFPPSAQRALVDMAYNCGLGGLAKFHHLATAVGKEDWAAAAAACTGSPAARSATNGPRTCS